MEKVIVSVIVPLLNEEKYIDNFITSLINQTYPAEKMEWILVDGNSTDKTREIINRYINLKRFPIKLLINKKRKTPYALNIGIKEAKGKYIVRLDAHAFFYSNYIEKCAYYLENIEAENVGGIAETSANTFVGKAISQMLSTKFGVGSSDFRVGDGNKYVDTVPFGAFRKEVFEKVGLFNIKLLRSEDNDMNARIRESGGKIWLAEDIRFKYYCRDTVKGILKMGLQNGNALFHTLKENPKAMSIRHFIPFLFLMSIILLPILSSIVSIFQYLFFLEIILYLMLDIYFSFVNKNFIYGLITIWLYPLFHIFYGLGSLISMIGIKLY